VPGRAGVGPVWVGPPIGTAGEDIKLVGGDFPMDLILSLVTCVQTLLGSVL
jgi:hypothetical protein